MSILTQHLPRVLQPSDPGPSTHNPLKSSHSTKTAMPAPGQPVSSMVYQPPSTVAPASYSAFMPKRPTLPHLSSSLTSGSASSARSSERPSGFPFFRRGSAMPVHFSPSEIEMGKLTPRPTGKGEMEVSAAAILSVSNSQDGRTKEEIALAKWRRWIIEQPISDPIANKPQHKPQHIAMTPLSTSSSTPSNRIAPSRNGSSESSGGSSSIPPRDLHVQHTDSIRALFDVELAVDEGLLAEATRRAASRPRRISTNPRLSEVENPFIDLASRLGSRRVRPLVIELVQALAHYIDAVWSVNHPGRRGPWVADQDRTEKGSWTSPMITAVQTGKASGHVNAEPREWDMTFWAGEVRFALREVDEVVGIYKGVGWAFDTAIRNGNYGEVEVGNVLGEDGQGGNLARLLNDLEEAIWGDGAPRPSDLAYDLPADFDPYAPPDLEDLAISASSSRPLADFFVHSHSNSPDVLFSPAPDSVYNMPDLVDAGALSEGGHSDPPMSPRDQGTTAVGMTLEEIGKRRHLEWLESRRGEVGW